jgi:hypothetical protein
MKRFRASTSAPRGEKLFRMSSASTYDMTPCIAAWQGIFCDAVHLENGKGPMMQNHRPPFPWQFGASLPWMDDD